MTQESSQHFASQHFELEQRLHSRLMEQVNLRKLEALPEAQAREQVESSLRSMIHEERIALNETERNAIIRNIENEIFGFGPLEPLLSDDSVSDILVNNAEECYIERRGKLEKTTVRFRDREHLLRIIQKIASAVGRRIDESSPMVDARLADGSRVNAVIAPLALDGPVLSIRKFSVDPMKMEDLEKFRSLMPPMTELIRCAVQARVNLIISGGTGSGKTTLLNAVSGFIPPTERILTIEDSAELQLQQPHVVRLETRPPNIEGRGEVRQRQLVRNALRMRPDRIIVGEVRGDEALDMLQAMNTGHDGSLSTIHANSSRDALTRLEHMVGMSGVSIPTRAVRQQIAAAIHLVIQTERLPDGRRVISSIDEITGMEQDVVNMQQIFLFERRGVDQRGRVQGAFRATGIRPMMLQRFRERGVQIDPEIFNPENEYE